MTNVTRLYELSNMCAIPERTDFLILVSSVKHSHCNQGEHNPFSSIIPRTLAHRSEIKNKQKINKLEDS
ncbi:hypothetical protein RHMOL_Rhmol13G0225300 [Rhododendron molle]|uniref:Uncharacterized protein n=1 Tax=Rhododendron molle TaxID=49168 RepID=A0ACC0LB22_RHOML|nr:hypothetical protein RHMOL_Rhmol13G0225300 [Rhododendron molle]